MVNRRPAQALLVLAGLLAWGFSTHHLGLRGGSIGYALAMVALGFLAAQLGSRPGWRPGRSAGLAAARTWASVVVVVLAVSIGIAFGLRSFDPALTRRLGLTGLVGTSNWFSSAVPLPGQLAEPDPLLGLFATSVAAQLALLWWAATRLWRRGVLPMALGLVAVGYAVQLLWFSQPTTAFFSTFTYALPFGLGVLAATVGRLPKVPAWLSWPALLVGSIAVSLAFTPGAHLFRLVALPLVSLLAALALASPEPPLPQAVERRLGVAARFVLWPALLGFAVRSLLGPQQLHLRGAWLVALQVAITFSASLLGYLLVASLPKLPAAARPIVGLVALPAFVFTLVLVDVAGTQTVFPPGVLHAGKAPVVPHAFPNPQHHLRSLLVGGTDAFGLSFGVPPTSERRGVLMNSDAVTDCGLVNDHRVIINGEEVAQYRGWRPGIGWVRCSTQLDRWRADLKVLHPEVVLLAEGSSEVRTWVRGGQQRSILDPEVAGQVREALVEAIDVLGSRGAEVVVTTAPYYGVGVPLGRYGNPQNDPDRVNAYNRIVRSVAKATGATVYNLNHPVCPERRFQIRAHRIWMRGIDGIVVTPQGGRYVQPSLLDQIKEAAR